MISIGNKIRLKKPKSTRFLRNIDMKNNKKVSKSLINGKENSKKEPRKFSFPPEEEIKKLLKRVEQPNYRRVNIGLHPDATPAEKAKGIVITDEQLKRKIISDELIRELIKQLDGERVDEEGRYYH